MDETNNYHVSYCSDPRFKLTVVKNKSRERCDVCQLDEMSPLRYGEFIVKELARNRKIQVHYFCLLSGTYIPQNGTTKAGIIGFKIHDIVGSYDEFRNKQCVYCLKPSAPIECAAPHCKRRFHYICGYKNSCVTQFCDQFLSYCDEHLPVEIRRPIHSYSCECDICFEDMPDTNQPDFNPLSVVRSCGIDDCIGIFHRECVQRFAFIAGYNFKCPMCFDKGFDQLAVRFGIFVPQRESAWEREPNAFEDLHKCKCTAEQCLVAQGDGGNQNKSKEAEVMVGCTICGGETMHKLCTGLQDAVDDYLCRKCRDQSYCKLLE